MITTQELVDVLPVIVSLVVIEGLLSVDNALAIAALASHLPKQQQTFALRIGILGAYLFRGLAMFLVALVIKHPLLKLVGAAYLIYLMASNLAAEEEGDDEGAEGAAQARQRSLFATVLQIEIMDLALSLDNVVAAVALDKRFWVVCTGVFIGILALRFLAGLCIKLIEKFPILEATAFLLIGFVGTILLVEITLELLGYHPGATSFGKTLLNLRLLELDPQGHAQITAYTKFLGITLILALSLLYDRAPAARALLRPLVAVGAPVMTVLDKVFGLVFWPAARCIHYGKAIFAHKPAVEKELTQP